MGEVHRLTAAGPIIEPIPEIVAKLKEMLAMAEAGDIKGIGYFLVRGNDNLRTAWISGCADQTDMIAGARLLEARVVNAALEGL